VTGLLASELLKLRTIRSTWGYVATAVGLAALITAGTIGSESEGGRLASDFQRRLVTDATAFAPTILALLLGITLVTNEFRHGTITPTLLSSPRRDRVVGAKLVTGAGMGVALVLVSLVVVALVGAPWLLLLDVPLEPLEGAQGSGRAFLSAALVGALGAAVGGIVHAQVAALVGTLVWLFVAESVLSLLLDLVDADGVAEFLPGAVIFALGDPASDGLRLWPAAGVALAYLAVGSALAVLRTSRRDIT
jgi:ABC-2 type transport system permease protein